MELCESLPLSNVHSDLGASLFDELNSLARIKLMLLYQQKHNFVKIIFSPHSVEGILNNYLLPS